MIDLDPVYRMADEGEIRLMKSDVIQKVMEERFAEKDPAFTRFVESYAAGKQDDGLDALVLKLYEFSMSYPWPEQWLEECRAAMDRIVTVTGQGIKNPQNFDVLSGTDMAELIEAAGGLTDNVSKVISGGPMMGFAMYDTHVPCIKTSSACLCLEKDDVADAEQTACINCGRCVGVCPGHVIPARLATFAEHGDMKSFQKFDGMECCECGCCSYICPAKRPLTQMIKSMRKMVLASRKKK